MIEHRACGCLVLFSSHRVKLSPAIASSLVTSSGAPAVDVRVLEQLFDLTPDIAFFIKDTSGRYIVVNHSLVERNGFTSKAQLVGRRASDVFAGDLGRIPSDQDAAVIRTGRPLLDHLELHLHRPRNACWCLTTKLPLRDAKGVIIGLIGISRDVRAPGPLDDIPAGMGRALDALEKSCAEAHTPATLANRAGLSPSRFARLVKRIYGITPSQLITKTRLAAAQRYLTETDRSVAEIALDCGFYDHSAFTRAFRAATGQTPTEHRRNTSS